MSYSREDLLEYERLFNLWCEAEKAAHDAVMEIVNDELQRKPIDPARRARVTELAVEARRLMMATLKKAPPTSRY